MLPMTGLSWNFVRSRVQEKFGDANLRVCLAFWLFGMIIISGYVLYGADSRRFGEQHCSYIHP